MATAVIENGNVPAIIGKMIAIRKAVGAVKKEGTGGVPYNFRGVDQVINAVYPALNEFGVLAVPTKAVHKHEQRLTGGTEKNGVLVGQKLLSISTITLDVTFYAEEDGSSITAQVIGEAQDYSDKSGAQAHSVAYRIAMLQAFTLPTDSPDPELNQEKAGGVEDVVNTKPAGPTVKELTDKIKAYIAEGSIGGGVDESTGVVTEGKPVTATEVNAVGDRISDNSKVWKTKPEVVSAVIAALEAGDRK